MSRRTFFVICFIGGFLGAWLADVADARPVTQPTGDAAYAAAGAYWEARAIDPCEGTWRRAHAPAVDDGDSNDGMLAGRNVAWAYEAEGGFPDGSAFCELTLDVTENWRALGAELGATGREFVCAVMVHERGHNAGLPHVEDWSSIMYGSVDHVPDECRAAL